MVSSLFENLLNAGQRKLVVVGYGFRDKHINEIIANALKHHQLQLYIMSPKQPIDFRSELFSIPNRLYNIEEIWNSKVAIFQERCMIFMSWDMIMCRRKQRVF